MHQKIYIKTHGCQMNEYDSSKMLDLLAKTHGVEATDIIEDADIILFNTCSIREKAQEKVFSELGRLRKLKKKKPHLKIGVGGCVASQEGELILKRAPYVDVVFGPQTIHRLPKMLDDSTRTQKPMVDISFPEIEKFDRLPEPRADGPTAFVSIMEGCSKYCSFCVVPYTRGEEVSRPIDSIIHEIATLAEQGVKEVNLLGQNVNAYRGLNHLGAVVDFAELLHYVSAIEGILRIRYTTSHPVEFSDALIDAYDALPKLVNHLHLPVQSGSDRILGLMKRGHTVLEYKSKLRKLLRKRPEMSLSSDFIIGFPGETEKDFEDTIKLIKAFHFDHSFSFIYSARPGTPAANLPDDTPEEVKKERLKRLQDLIREQANTISQNMVGNTEWVLIDNVSRKNPQEISGRTENNRLVKLIGPKSYLGALIPVTITEAFVTSLRGRVATEKL